MFDPVIITDVPAVTETAEETEVVVTETVIEEPVTTTTTEIIPETTEEENVEVTDNAEIS